MTVDIRRLTAHLSTSQQDEIAKAYKKQQENETAVFLWCFFLGWMGAHRFYLRQWGQAFIHLLIVLIMAGIIVVGVLANLNPTLVVLTALPFGLAALIWEIIDLFHIDDEVSARNLKVAEVLIAGSMLADTTIIQATQTKLDEIVQNEAAKSSVATEREEAATADATTAEVAAASSETSTGGDVAAMAIEGGAGEAIERYEATTVTRAGDEPDSKPADEQPVQPGTRDWSESDTSTASELTADEVSEGTLSESGEAEGVQLDETVTRAHTESGFSVTDSVDTQVGASAAESEDTVITADMTPMSTAEGEAPTWPNLPHITDIGLAASAGMVDYTDMGLAASAGTVDYTDMGGSERVADVDGVEVTGAMPLIVSLRDDATSTDGGAAASEEATTIPPESYTPPVVPVVQVPDSWVQPAGTAAEESEAPETLAELAGLAAGTAGGVAGTEALSAGAPVTAATAATAATPQVAHADEEIEHSSHLLKRIRVTRQIKVNGEVIDETSAEELIEADADPEPVRQRLRQQLHNQAAARMSELGITEDQADS